MKFSSIAFGIVSLFFSVTPFSTQADTINVTTTSDELDEIGAGNGCSLREAIQAANSDSAVGGCPAGGGTDTINLPSGTYQLTRSCSQPFDDTNEFGDFDIRSSLIVRGNPDGGTIVEGLCQTTDPNPERLFHTMSPGGESIIVELKNLILRGGRAVLGGALLVDEGTTLTLRDSTLRGNQATNEGGAILNRGITLGIFTSVLEDNWGRNGGAISNVTNLTVSGSPFLNNRSDQNGGAIISWRESSLDVDSSLFQGNRAVRWGGALFILGQGNVRESTLSENQSEGNEAAQGRGGAIYAGGILTMNNSTLTQNQTGVNGANGIGGAIFQGGSNDPQSFLTNCTIAANHVSLVGGGIYRHTGTMALTHVTVAQNISRRASGELNRGGGIASSDADGVLVIANSLIVNNDGDPAPDCAGRMFASFGGNIVGNNLGCRFEPMPNDQVGTPEGPLVVTLGPLGDYGGSTKTISLIEGSAPAVGQADPQQCPRTDQRDVVRLDDAQGDTSCDVGAFESSCGDGLISGRLEQCDDGNGIDTDACTNNCTVARCGDNITGTDEQCDDGNEVNDDPCSNNCQTARCGDNIVQEGEACDDGNADNQDLCNNVCQAARCGDGIPQAVIGEECDAGGGEADDCDTDCTRPVCGDGISNGVAGEGCDDGNTNDRDACRNSCISATCGDGILQENVEECDNGPLNGNDPDACRTNCLLSACGDGVRDRGEGCDNGADNSDTVSNACRLDCREPRCGDRVVDDGEGCDDGNQNNMDACRNDCGAATCGDGVVQEGMEQCDEGDQNRNEPNVCRTTCTLPTCGDGIRDQNEQCDDGNIVDTDTCSSACRNVVREAGFLPGGAVTQGGDQAPAQPAQPAQPTSPGGGCSLIIDRRFLR